MRKVAIYLRSYRKSNDTGPIRLKLCVPDQSFFYAVKLETRTILSLHEAICNKLQIESSDIDTIITDENILISNDEDVQLLNSDTVLKVERKTITNSNLFEEEI